MKRYIVATATPDFENLYDFSSFHMKADENSYWGDPKQPIQSSLCKRLNNKPINTLTLEDIVVLYTMRDAKFNYQLYDGNFIKWLANAWERHEEDFRSCYNWVHTLTFPLTIYRAVTDEQELTQDISGKSKAWSWTTDPNLYSADNSIFKKCKNIYSAEINANVISNIYTISNFVFYSSRPQYGRYPEYEITLKDRFKMSDLYNLTKIK